MILQQVPWLFNVCVGLLILYFEVKRARAKGSDGDKKAWDEFKKWRKK